MNFNEYQRGTATTAIYPGTGDPDSTHGLSYVTLGLVGEAGEIANKVKKILRDGDGVITSEHRQDLKKEAGDVAWYLSQLCNQLDIWLEQVCTENLDKLADRAARGVLQGSGDSR